MIVHDVFFTLYDSSPEAIEHMVQECHQYLKNHPGVIFFAAGKCEEELARPVNDRLYHVALHVVFDTRQSHDDYQVAESHLRFIENNKAGWKQVRIFDSIC